MRVVGVGFVCFAIILVYIFAARGSISGKDMIQLGRADESLPLIMLGREYPTDVFVLMGAVGALAFGLALAIRSRSSSKDAPPAGRFATASWVSAFICVTMILAGYVGGKSEADPRLVGIFILIGCVQAFFGLLMLPIGFKLEKGTRKTALVTGSLVHVAAAAFLAAMMLNGA